MTLLTLSQQKPEVTHSASAAPVVTAPGDFQAAITAVDAALENYLRPASDVPERLREAILYSIRAGGKRLRPALVVMVCQACGGTTEQALPAASAVEMIHTFSLIHDDLPAMDDDDLRRGRPTNHKIFGEGMAVLAGDALVTYAFETIARQVEDAKKVRRLVVELAGGAGATGMIGGQVVDILHENRSGDLETVKYIHTHKTARLFATACRMGAISANAGDDLVEAVGTFGLKLGQAFQIVDDLLDVLSSPQTLGKNTQKDRHAGKLTYPALIGTDASQQQASELMDQARTALQPLGSAGDALLQLTDYIAQRTH